MKVLQNDFTEGEMKRISSIIKKGDIGFGANVPLFEGIFSERFSKKPYNTATNSASAAVFMIFAYLKEKYGSCDVYTPSLGFTSPAWAAKHFGHRIIWVDVDDNLLFDVKDYREKRKHRCERYTDCHIKPVIMPILYGGVSNIPGLDTIHRDNYNEIIVLDAAHCPTPTLKYDFAFFSFHPTKPICTSDGGMVSTDNKEASEYFQTYRNFGRVNTEGGYNITQEGFKFYMNNLNATLALESLKRYDLNVKLRKSNYENLDLNRFKGRLLPHNNNSSYYFATLISEDAKQINEEYNLQVHYPLLHKTDYYEYSPLPNTEKLHKQIINLPLWKLI